MIHKISIAGILAIIAYIVYTSLYKGFIIWPFLLLMAVLAAVYYITTSLVTSGMVKKALGCDNPSFIIRAGFIEKNGKDLTNGIFAISGSRIMMFARKGDLGGCRIIFESDVADVESYSIGKVDDYHTGLILELRKKKGTCRFTSKKFPECEAALREALGWTAEEETENS